MPGTIYFPNWAPFGEAFQATHTINFTTSPDTWSVLLTGSYGQWQAIKARALEFSVSGANSITLTIDGVAQVYYPGAYVVTNLVTDARSITITGYGVDAFTFTLHSTSREEAVSSFFRPNTVPRQSQYVDASSLRLEYSGIAATPYQWAAVNLAPFNSGLATTPVLVLPADATRIFLAFGGDMNMPAALGKFWLEYGYTATIGPGYKIGALSPGMAYCNAPLVTQPIYLSLRYIVGVDPAPGAFGAYNAGFIAAEHWLA